MRQKKLFSSTPSQLIIHEIRSFRELFSTFFFVHVFIISALVLPDHLLIFLLFIVFIYDCVLFYYLFLQIFVGRFVDLYDKLGVFFPARFQNLNIFFCVVRLIVIRKKIPLMNGAIFLLPTM
jgi:hypothetical protein